MWLLLSGFFPQSQRGPGKSQLLHRDTLPLFLELLCPKELSHDSPASLHHPA